MTAMDELSRLLVAERATKAPTLVKQQGFERLAQSVAAGTPPLPVSAAALQLGRWLPFKWLGVGFVVGVVAATGAAQLAAQSDSPERADNTARSGVLPSAAVGSTAAEPVPSLPATGVAGAPAELPAGTRGGSPTFASSQSAPTASSAPTFDEELRLITNAKQELDAGRPQRARAWLDEHQQRFNGGVFALEREGLSLLARCSQRPDPVALDGFAARHPESPMLERLKRTCRVGGADHPPPSPAGNFSSFPNEPGSPGERMGK